LALDGGNQVILEDRLVEVLKNMIV
jgi:hypothetical protein